MLYSKEKLKSCERAARLPLYENVYSLPNTKLSVNILITCVIIVTPCPAVSNLFASSR